MEVKYIAVGVGSMVGRLNEILTMDLIRKFVLYGGT